MNILKHQKLLPTSAIKRREGLKTPLATVDNKPIELRNGLIVVKSNNSNVIYIGNPRM